MSAEVMLLLLDALGIDISELGIDEKQKKALQRYKKERDDLEESMTEYSLPEAIQSIKQSLNALNDVGIWTAVERVEELTYIPKYSKRK